MMAPQDMAGRSGGATGPRDPSGSGRYSRLSSVWNASIPRYEVGLPRVSNLLRPSAMWPAQG